MSELPTHTDGTTIRRHPYEYGYGKYKTHSARDVIRPISSSSGNKTKRLRKPL